MATPDSADEFVRKWRNVELKERSAAQEHFIDLCRVLGEPTPAEADPIGEFYSFEKGATKSTGGEGWADVWKRGHFGWEYKGRRKDLPAPYRSRLKRHDMILQEDFTLSNGVTIPKLGLGTWFIDDDKAAQAVRDAVEVGYRHIDTAEAYGNERGVGEGVRSCGLERDEVFVTTKLRAEVKSYDASRAAIDGSLRDLGLDHIDLMIIHSPQPWAEFKEGEHFFEENLQAWRALEEAYKAGKLRAIGVSNFDPIDVDNIIKNGSIKPMVNQVLAHVANTPFNVIEHGRANRVLIEAYSPVAHGAILKDPNIASIAHKYGVSVAQLCIRYCLELGMLPLPKTANPAHMRENAAVDFQIAAADLESLKKSAPIQNYGDASRFPVFSGKLSPNAR